jgi:predicted GNAT family N-acyltransferase
VTGPGRRDGITRVGVRQAVSPADLRRVRDLRRRVFIEEQGVPEVEEYDVHDATAFHALALLGGNAVATGRLIGDDSGGARIGRMAVDAGWRRRGVGGLVLAFLEQRARLQGYRGAALHAQRYVEAFYRSHGYVAEGRPFDEAGIEHITMRKAL